MEPTVDQKTDDRANVVTGTDDRLPFGRDNQFTFDVVIVAKPLTVGRMGEKVVDETDIHPLHDQSHGQKRGVDGGGTVALKKLHAWQINLSFRAGDGGLDELLLREVNAINRAWPWHRLRISGSMPRSHCDNGRRR